MYLLDTVVLSELRRRQRNPGVVAWMEEQRDNDVFLSVITIGEIEQGIVRKRMSDPAFAEALAGWLDGILMLYRDRIIGIDLSTARRWGRLSGEIGHAGADLMIASSALEHGLTVVTRNTRHFQATGVGVVDPFS